MEISCSGSYYKAYVQVCLFTFQINEMLVRKISTHGQALTLYGIRYIGALYKISMVFKNCRWFGFLTFISAGWCAQSVILVCEKS